MSPGSQRWLIISGILVSAFAVRMATSLWWQHRLGEPNAFGMPDTDSYWVLGQRLAEGRPYQYGDFRVFRAPGYPLLLAGMFRLLGTDASMIWARAMGALLGTSAVGAVMWLANCSSADVTVRESPPLQQGLVGMIAGGLAAVYPGAIAMSTFVLAEALFCPLMIWHLVAWVRATQVVSAQARVTWSVAGGVAAGLAILTRPSWLLFTPFVLILLVLTSRQLLVGMCMLVAISVTMLPWWIRNYRVVGHFVPTTLQVGASLYDGLNPAATGESNMAFSTSVYQAQKAADAAAGRSADGFEVRLDRRLRDAALDWAAHHPGQVLRLAAYKLVRMWNVWPNAEEFRGWGLRFVVAAGYVPLLVLGLAGAWRWRRLGWPLVLCLLPAVYFTGLHMVFVSSIRYRQPAMLTWLILPAAVIACWLQRSGATARIGKIFGS
jgi:4-amino-4-deoxy-L-arabinose transferase-like glycosyltransferase